MDAIESVLSEIGTEVPCRNCGAIEVNLKTYPLAGIRVRLECGECDQKTEYALTQEQAEKMWKKLNAAPQPQQQVAPSEPAKASEPTK